MASWSELLHEVQRQKDPGAWLNEKLDEHLSAISTRRNNTSVIFYASAFLQKQNVEGSHITREDINGFMNALYELPTDNDLTLILHTPGGDPNAVESIVEYLHSKFDKIEVIVPYLAMSGGAMMSLAGDLLVLGKQSQLGPIDPQFTIGNKTHSARAIQEGFDQAREEIKRDTKLAHLWAPVLQNMGPSLFLEANKALSYSKELVEKWLEERMFRDIVKGDRKERAEEIGAYFNAEKTRYGSIHVHGQRIGTGKLQELGIKLEFLEDDQDLQDDVLTAYHLMTLIFEMTDSIKFIVSSKGKSWFKNRAVPQAFIPVPPPVPQQQPQ